MLKAQPLKRVPRASSREKAQVIGFLRSGAAAVVFLLFAALLAGALYQSVESFLTDAGFTHLGVSSLSTDTGCTSSARDGARRR